MNSARLKANIERTCEVNANHSHHPLSRNTKHEKYRGEKCWKNVLSRWEIQLYVFLIHMKIFVKSLPEELSRFFHVVT